MERDQCEREISTGCLSASAPTRDRAQSPQPRRGPRPGTEPATIQLAGCAQPTEPCRPGLSYHILQECLICLLLDFPFWSGITLNKELVNYGNAEKKERVKICVILDEYNQLMNNQELVEVKVGHEAGQ